MELLFPVEKLSADAEGKHSFVGRESVVLCAGSIKSPQLLMLSGIGAEAELASHGIKCRIDLPGGASKQPMRISCGATFGVLKATFCVTVGKNLMDHPCFSLAFHCSKPGVSLDWLGQPAYKLAAGVQYLLGLGDLQNVPAASNIWEVGGVVFGKRPCSLALGYPNLQYHFAPILAEDKYDGAQMTLKPGFQMQIDLLRPFSRGYITLRSADPTDDPVRADT